MPGSPLFVIHTPELGVSSKECRLHNTRYEESLFELEPLTIRVGGNQITLDDRKPQIISFEAQGEFIDNEVFLSKSETCLHYSQPSIFVSSVYVERPHTSSVVNLSGYRGVKVTQERGSLWEGDFFVLSLEFSRVTTLMNAVP